MGFERKNLNRGFKKLRVWQDAVSLYALAFEVFNKFPWQLQRVASNSIDAAHSISINISEGYCRRSIKEYLQFLNFALGSCGEFHSCHESFKLANQITEEEYEKLDKLHYRLENGLIRLISSIQKKSKIGEWDQDLSS